MRKYLLWLWLSGRRLLKKPLFLALLLALPLLTVCYTAAVKQSSGVISVVLAVEGTADELAVQVLDTLQTDGGLISYQVGDVQSAKLLVETGKADAAWIFPGNMSQRVAAFVNAGETGFVRVLQRQDNVLLRLSREKLSGALYECCAAPAYLRYLRQNAPQLAALSDEKLVGYMTWFRGNDSLFAFEQTDGSGIEPMGYLLSPLRGMLGILILLCALAAAMYFLEDRMVGMFQGVPASFAGFAEFGGQLAALLGVSAVAAACLAFCGSWAGLWRETAVTVLYVLSCASFGCLLRRICRKTEVLAGILPLVAAVALVICPVFVEISGLGFVRYLLPPGYYVRAVDSDFWLLLMPVYAGVCGIGCVTLDKLSKSK